MTPSHATDRDDTFLRVVATCAAISLSALGVVLWLRRIGW